MSPIPEFATPIYATPAYFLDAKDNRVDPYGGHPGSRSNKPAPPGLRLPSYWNHVFEILRELHPQKQWVPDFPNAGLPGISTDQSLAYVHLMTLGAKDWSPLGQTLIVNLNNPFFEFGVGESFCIVGLALPPLNLASLSAASSVYRVRLLTFHMPRIVGYVYSVQALF